MEPQCKEHLYDEVLGMANDFLRPSDSKIYEKSPVLRNLVIANIFC